MLSLGRVNMLGVAHVDGLRGTSCSNDLVKTMTLTTDNAVPWASPVPRRV